MNDALFRRLGALLLATTFGPAGVEKLSSPSVPDWFLKQFSETFLAAVPGALPFSFFALGVGETVVALAMGVVFLAKDSRRIRRVSLLGTSGAVFLFIALAFGQRLSRRYDGALALFLCAFAALFLLRESRDADA